MIYNDQMVKVLVIEDDPVLGKAVTQGLSDQGYQCQLIIDSAAAVRIAQQEQFHVILLDLALEDDSALGVLRCIREVYDNANIIVLTPLEFRQERIAGLEAGADDFIIKPFAMNELRARVEAALIRSRTRPKTMLEVGPLTMDLTARKVVRNGRQIPLTPTEFRILEILMRNQAKVVTRRMLCEFLWNPEWEGVTNVIEVHINRLRTKITNDSMEPQMIFTVRGSGYSLRWDAAVDPTQPSPVAQDGSSVSG